MPSGISVLSGMLAWLGEFLEAVALLASYSR